MPVANPSQTVLEAATTADRMLADGDPAAAVRYFAAAAGRMELLSSYLVVQRLQAFATRHGLVAESVRGAYLDAFAELGRSAAHEAWMCAWVEDALGCERAAVEAMERCLKDSDPEEFVTAIESFLGGFPTFVPGYVVLSRLLEVLDDLPQAAKVARMAIAVDEAGRYEMFTRAALARAETRPWSKGVPVSAGRDEPRLKGRFCAVPFERLDILEGGYAHQCCATFVPTAAGSVRDHDWRSVWNSDVAMRVRKSILDGEFAWCDHDKCPLIVADKLPTLDEAMKRYPHLQRAIEAGNGYCDVPPDFVNLSYDRSCNLSCPSCRTERYVAGKEDQDEITHITESAVLPMLKTASTVFITGSGDPFASKSFRRVMATIDDETAPGVQVDLLSNGVLWDERTWSEFPNLHDRLRFVNLSVDATTEATYDIVRRGGDFDRLMHNLEFIAGLRHDGVIRRLGLIFIVQHANFREMEDFVHLGERLGVDIIGFNKIFNWGTYTEEQFRRVAVFDPEHPDHDEFAEIVARPAFDAPAVQFLSFGWRELAPRGASAPAHERHLKTAVLAPELRQF